MKSEILVAEWPNGSRQLCLKLNVKKNVALRLVNGKLTNIKKKQTKERKGKRLVENFLTNDIRNLNEGLYQEYLKKHF